MIVNERFIKLALDAGLLNYVDHETPRRYFVHGHAEQEEVEKFAKLIVRECMEWCDAHATIDGTAQQIRDSIKKDFGVE
jgi:hypothetical protein